MTITYWHINIHTNYKHLHFQQLKPVLSPHMIVGIYQRLGKKETPCFKIYEFLREKYFNDYKGSITCKGQLLI